MIVYGGGEACKSFADNGALAYVDPYQVDQRNSRKGGRPIMAKSYGGSRALWPPGSKRIIKADAEIIMKMMTGDYSEGYFSDKAGGYYLLVEKAMQKHSDEEGLRAAKILCRQRLHCKTSKMKQVL